MVKTIKNISSKIRTLDNFRLAEDGYASDKRNRRKVKKFERDLDGNLTDMLTALKDDKWQPLEYHDKYVVENKKVRKLAIYPMPEHVMEWTHNLHLEKPLTDTYIRHSCSCVKGRGQNDFINLIYHDLQRDYVGTYYFVQLDAHHFFPNICHEILKDRLAKKIKDKQVLNFLYRTIDNYNNGIVLGTKLSQIEGNFYLVPFDYDALRFFGILDDKDMYAYWKRRYVSDCIVTCRTEAQARELNNGVDYLGKKFDRLVREWIRNGYYYRFADNMLGMSSDKTFLHIFVEIAISRLWAYYRVQINKSWNVRPVESGGIDICGYVLFHDHILVRKRNKKKLCKQVAKLKKKGRTPEQIKRECASRLGWATHADCRNLFRKLGIPMSSKRIGKYIKKKNIFIPFEGLTHNDKESILNLLCATERDEQSRLLMLEDFLVTPSHSKEKSNGKTLWLKYKHITKQIPKVDKDGKPIKDDDGDPEYDYECESGSHYTCTSSSVLLDQAQNDLSKEEFPQPTAIYIINDGHGHSYYKFT